MDRQYAITTEYRGITLLSVLSKILGNVLVDQIKDGVDNKLREEQDVEEAE